MRFDRAFTGSDPAGRRARDLRPETAAGVLAVGTLACPDCDAPTHPGPTAIGPADGLACPVCSRHGAVRDFFSLASPARPARVVVRLRVGRRSS